MVILQTPAVQWREGAVYHGDMAELELKTFGERVAWLLKRRRLADQPTPAGPVRPVFCCLY